MMQSLMDTISEQHCMKVVCNDLTVKSQLTASLASHMSNEQVNLI